MRLTDEPWTFCDLPVVVIKQTVSLEEEWFQIV